MGLAQYLLTPIFGLDRIMYRFSSLRSDEGGVTKDRRRRDDKACDPHKRVPKGTAGVLVEHVEEPEDANAVSADGWRHCR